MSSSIDGALGSAMGIVASSVPVMGGLVVIDAISGLIKCRKCGYSSRNRKKVVHHARQHKTKKTKKTKYIDYGKMGRQIYKDFIG